MRSLSLAAVMVPALLAAMPAGAQVYYQQGRGIPAPGGMVATPRVGMPVNVPQQQVRQMPPRHGYPQPTTQPQRGNRWGGQIGGRWWGGSRAPGGWGSYRRPSRGWNMPGYWMQSNFRIPDYYSFGLRQPGNGYFWVRYYDDAVLVDSRGRVIDWSDGVRWDDAGDGDYGYDADASYGGSQSYSYSQATVNAGGIRQVDPNAYYDQAPPYGAPYPGGYASPAAGAPPAVQVQGYPAGYGAGYGSSYGSSYSSGGYYAGGGTTTTIVIQPAPIVTTTVSEEVIEEETVTTYVTPRRTVRRPVRKYRPKPRPTCSCACQCR